MAVFSEDLFDVFEKKEEPVTPSVKKKKKRVRESAEESSWREEEPKRAKSNVNTDSSGEGPSSKGEPGSSSETLTSTGEKPEEANKEDDG